MANTAKSCSHQAAISKIFAFYGKILNAYNNLTCALIIRSINTFYIKIYKMAFAPKSYWCQAAVPKYFKLYSKILNAYNLVGMLPLTWTGDQMKVTESKRWWFAVKVALIWSHTVALNVLCIRNWFTEGPTITKLHFTLQASVSTAATVNFRILLHSPHFVAAMVNNSLRTRRRHDKFGFKDEGKASLLVFKVTLFVCVFAPLTAAIRVLENPNNPPSLLSLTSNPTEVAVPWRIICWLYQLYGMAGLGAGLWVTVSTVTVYLRTLTGTIRAIRSKKAEDRVKAINETTILQGWFNSIFGGWTSVWEATFIWLVVVDLTCAVIQESIRNLLVGLSIATMMICLYKNMGTVYEDSKDTMNVAVPGAHDASWFKRKRRAYRALRVNAGSFHFVDKRLVLTMISVASESTANLILALRGA